MSLADIIAGAVGIARDITVPGGLTVQVKVLLASQHAYDATTDTMTDTGTQTEIPALRWQEQLQVSTGLRSRGHRLDGLIASTEKIMFFGSDLKGINLKQDDVIQLLADDGTTWQRWQLKDVAPVPTRAAVICSIERS